MGAILEHDELQAMTGYDRPADIERCLQRQGIKVFHGRRGKLWTTVDLVNAAGGLHREPPSNDGPLSPDILG